MGHNRFAREQKVSNINEMLSAWIGGSALHLDKQPVMSHKEVEIQWEEFACTLTPTPLESRGSESL